MTTRYSHPRSKNTFNHEHQYIAGQAFDPRIEDLCYSPNLLKGQKFCDRQTRCWLGLPIFRLEIFGKYCNGFDIVGVLED